MWNNQVFSNDNNLNNSSAVATTTPVNYYNKDDNHHQQQQQNFDHNGSTYSSYIYNAGENYIYDRDADTDQMNRQTYYDTSNQTNYNPDHFNSYSNQNNDALYNGMPDCSNSSAETNSANSTEDTTSFNNPNVDNSRQHYSYENNDRISSESSPSKPSISPSSSSSSSFDQSIKKSSTPPNSAISVLPTMLMSAATCSLTTTTNTITVSPAVSVLLNSNETYNNSPITTWNTDYYNGINNQSSNPNSYNAYNYSTEILSANNLNNASMDYSLSSMHQRAKSNFNLDFDGLNNSYLINQYSSTNNSNKAYSTNLTFSNELPNTTSLISTNSSNAIHSTQISNNNANNASLIKETFSLSANRANLNTRLTSNYQAMTQSSSALFNHENELEILHNHEFNEASDLNQTGLILKSKKNYSGKY